MLDAPPCRFCNGATVAPGVVSPSAATTRACSSASSTGTAGTGDASEVAEDGVEVGAHLRELLVGRLRLLQEAVELLAHGRVVDPLVEHVVEPVTGLDETAGAEHRRPTVRVGGMLLQHLPGDRHLV